MAMVFFRRLGESKKFAFEASSCIQAECWRPGITGKKPNGDAEWGCTTPAAHGCPRMDERNLDDKVEANRRKAGGWLGPIDK